MNKQKDYVAEIMQQWYDAMDKEKVGVQPKCATILGTIMAKYNITLVSMGERDIWAEALKLSGGEFLPWYNALSDSEKQEYTDKLMPLQDSKRDKSLLKG
tara:strand:- start:663 stop:962 length:300 start_codon:yes stop_codon:yes gene_type:complete